MGTPGLQAREYAAEVLTARYLIAGDLAPLGPLLIYLNQTDRGAVTMRAVSATALEAHNPVESFRAEELIVAKDDIVAIRLLHPVTQTAVQLLPRRERLLVFTSLLIVRAAFHCGPDTRVGDLFESTPGRWAPASEAQVFPLLPMRPPVFSQARLLLVNKRHVRMYHAISP